jgi:hypothetical protein
MGAPDILTRLESMGLRLSLRGLSIWVEPKGAITNDARKLTRDHKSELIRTLSLLCPPDLLPRFSRACADLPLSVDELADYLSEDFDDSRTFSDSTLRLLACNLCLKLERYSPAVLAAWPDDQRMPCGRCRDRLDDYRSLE